MSAITLPRTTEGPLTAENVRQNHSEVACNALLRDFAAQVERGTVGPIKGVRASLLPLQLCEREPKVSWRSHKGGGSSHGQSA